MENHFDPNNDWRKVASTIYKKPVDSKIFGTIELDVTALETFVLEKRHQGLKITIMHPMILFVARALKQEVPALNCYVSRGRIIHRRQVDALVSVLIRGGDQLGSVRVPEADKLTLREIAAILAREVPHSRKGIENKTMGLKNLLAALPWPFRSWITGFMKWLVIDLGISIPGLGLSPNSFGSFVFSNIGSIGLDVGYAALMPFSNLALVLTMGSVQTKPAMLDGQIVPRRILTLSAVFDHRVVDAAHGGRLFRYLKRAVRTPYMLEDTGTAASAC